MAGPPSSAVVGRAQPPITTFLSSPSSYSSSLQTTHHHHHFISAHTIAFTTITISGAPPPLWCGHRPHRAWPAAPSASSSCAASNSGCARQRVQIRARTALPRRRRRPPCSGDPSWVAPSLGRTTGVGPMAANVLRDAPSSDFCVLNDVPS
ncbi:putative leucine-rich repeat extensin-like protein 3 [Iris pallida]|uniref:Leucine-rich repeat extensin-like protein 3 n=1 Tax=Iris pallida TaxID=29817 RepID=A0AAX6DZ19_IRIPA|nr:putative leucine-rich repeat extensin-like protein 3 [Iris pallida]